MSVISFDVRADVPDQGPAPGSPSLIALAPSPAYRVECAVQRQPPGALCELRELTYRYQTKVDQRGARVRVPRPLPNSRAAGVILSQLLEDEAVEVFGVLCLTSRRAVICWHEVARGSVDGAAGYVRDIFRPAIVSNAPVIIAAHNHPSGDPQPSAADVSLTQSLVDTGTLLGIEVLDHIIIGHRRFESLVRLWPSLFQPG